MIDEIFVIDDVINKNYQDSIEKTLIDNIFPWYFQKDITYNQINEINKGKKRKKNIINM